MTDYYFYPDNDPSNAFGYLPVPIDDVVAAMQRIAKKEGFQITDADILSELGLKKKQGSTRKISGKRRRISLYIDGTNLFAGQYDLFGPNRVLSFRSLLGDIKRYYPVTRIYFYASYTPRLPKRRPASFFAAESLFYREVKSTLSVVFYKGHRSPTSGKEKGVDVHLALDMVKDAFLKRYDEAVIMTGDADLMYPVEIISGLKYSVHAVFLPNRFSLELAYKTHSSIILNYQRRFRSNRKLPKQLRSVAIKSPTCKQVG